jgi:hypothetical protein
MCHRLDLAGVTIDIVVPDDWPKELCIPECMTGFRSISNPSDIERPDSPQPTIRYTGDEDFSVRLDESGGVLVSGPTDVFAKGPELAFIAQALSERQRQENGGALIHAAAVANRDETEAILILGEKGSGKTLSSLELCRRGFKLIGNDQVIVEQDSPEGLAIIDGSRFFLIRKTAADIALKDWFSVLPVDGRPAWNTKAQLAPAELGLASSNRRVPLVKVVQVQTDFASQPQPIIERSSDSLQTQLFLAEKMTRHISGSATPVLNEHGAIGTLLPSFDTPAARAQRLRLINQLQDLQYTRIFAADAATVADAIEAM